jgi:hypothetical protein
MCFFSKADEPIELPDGRRLSRCATRRAGITALQVGAMPLPLGQA